MVFFDNVKVFYVLKLAIDTGVEKLALNKDDEKAEEKAEADGGFRWVGAEDVAAGRAKDPDAAYECNSEDGGNLPFASVVRGAAGGQASGEDDLAAFAALGL